MVARVFATPKFVRIPRRRPALMRIGVTPAVYNPAAGAILVGVLGGAGTTVVMTPADLTIGPRTDITDFRVSIDAGSYS